MKGSNGVLSGGQAQTYLGKMSAYRKANETLLRGTVPTIVSNPRTAAQMYQRLKMYSSAPLYKVLSEAIALGWEKLPAKQSLYNRFTAGAMQSSPYGITKAMYDKGAGIAWGAQITSGSLPAITVLNHISNIRLSNLAAIDENTTVAAFAKAVVEGNPGVFEYDDEIAFVEVIQYVDPEGVPKLTCTRTAVVLDASCQETFASMPSLKGFASKSGYLGIAGAPALGAYTWIHSRIVNGKMRISSQSLLTNNETILKAYGTAARLRTAAKSLGADLLSEKFLKPTDLKGRIALKAFDLSASSIKGAASTGQDGIVAVVYDGGTYLAGNTAPVIDKETAPSMKVQVTDGSKLASSVQVKVNGQNATSVMKTDNDVTFTLPQGIDGETLASVLVLDMNQAWKIEF